MALVQQTNYGSKKRLPGTFSQPLAQRRNRMSVILLAFVVVVAILTRLFSLGYPILALWSGCALLASLFISGAAKAADACARRR